MAVWRALLCGKFPGGIHNQVRHVIHRILFLILCIPGSSGPRLLYNRSGLPAGISHDAVILRGSFPSGFLQHPGTFFLYPCPLCFDGRLFFFCIRLRSVRVVKILPDQFFPFLQHSVDAAE